MVSRPEVFDWRCRLFFYRADGSFGISRGLMIDEIRFVAVPDDLSVGMVLRGVMASPVQVLADRGRLLGIRQGSPSALWSDEARKVGLDPAAGFQHDLVLECRWYPDPVPVLSPARAYWPSSADVDV